LAGALGFLVSFTRGIKTLLPRAKILHCLDKFLEVLARVFHSAATLEVSLPLRGLGERFSGVLIESLGHDRDEIADDPCVIEQRIDNRVSQFCLIGIVRVEFGMINLIVGHRLSFRGGLLPAQFD